jgi:hypothetical protein
MPAISMMLAVNSTASITPVKTCREADESLVVAVLYRRRDATDQIATITATTHAWFRGYPIRRA